MIVHTTLSHRIYDLDKYVTVILRHVPDLSWQYLSQLLNSSQTCNQSTSKQLFSSFARNDANVAWLCVSRVEAYAAEHIFWLQSKSSITLYSYYRKIISIYPFTYLYFTERQLHKSSRSEKHEKTRILSTLLFSVTASGNIRQTQAFSPCKLPLNHKVITLVWFYCIYIYSKHSVTMFEAVKTANTVSHRQTYLNRIV